jgi:PAS domain S-box-containing protein
VTQKRLPGLEPDPAAGSGKPADPVASQRPGDAGLLEAYETLEAIRSGSVDAFVVRGTSGERVYVLETADAPYRMMVEQMQQGAATVSADGVVLYANPRLAALAGREGAGLAATAFEGLFPVSEREAVKRLLQSALAQPGALETRLVGAAGETPVFLSASALETETPAVCVMVTDLTEQKRMEALESALEHFRVLADSSPVPIWVIDRDGSFQFVNRAYAEFFGVTVEEACSTRWMPPLHPDDEGRYATALANALLHRRELRLATRMRRRDGEWRWIAHYGAPWLSSAGEFLGCVGSSPDVSDMKTVEEALRRADRQKDQFLATLAHELRNPLAPIRNAVAIQRAKAPAIPELSWSREVIDRQVAHMARMLDDLLDVSRITQSKLQLRRERLDLASVVNAALETARPLIEAGGHELQVRLPEQLVVVDADLVRLSQAISNLLNNAAKYTDRGGRISLECSASGPLVELRVRDNGMGIPREALGALFQMFSQSPGALERAQGGLGIGLSLVRGIVGLHGGTVEARSEGPGKGSEFIMRLPIATAGAAPQVEARGDVLTGGARLRVLVADDNRDTADSLALVLSLAGYDVRTSYDGAHALAVAEEFRPQVALLDVGMPQASGCDVASRIRREPWGRDVFLVAQTGWGQDEDHRRTSEAGFDHHLVKPVSPATITELLASFRERPLGGAS